MYVYVYVLLLLLLLLLLLFLPDVLACRRVDTSEIVSNVH